MFCISNEAEVLNYQQPCKIITYITLSQRTKINDIRTLHSQIIKTDKATRNFIKFAEKHEIAVFPKYYLFFYNKKSSNETVPKRNIWQSDGIQHWLTAESIHQGKNLLINQFNWIQGFYLSGLKSPLILSNGCRIQFSGKWPDNVTVGQLKELQLDFTHTENIPIADKKSVKTIYIKPTEDFDLTVLQQFTILKQLCINGQQYKSRTTPFLPYLESLFVRNTKVIINTSNLRELHINGIDIDEETVAFITNQTRLIKLVACSVNKALEVLIPVTLRQLVWTPIIDEETDLLVNHLVKQCGKLTLREFKTNILLDNTKWLKKNKIESWRINDVERNRIDNKWVLSIDNKFKIDFPYLNRQADSCEI